MSLWRERLAARQKIEEEAKRETAPVSVEMPKIYMVRHLERIDVTNRPSSKEYKEWNETKKKDYKYLINPYLDIDTEISIGRLTSNLDGVHIDHIVCSPYVRCIQTAILIVNLPGIDIMDKTIHIDYKLGEFVDESYSFKVPLNIEDVYSHSRTYIKEKFNTKEYVLDNKDNKGNTSRIICDFETREKYNKRILDELKNIREKYTGNVLVVTHADAYKQFNKDKIEMNYGKIYQIDHAKIYQIDLDAVGGYREKYIKYKTKYLELRSKIKRNNFQ
jgi:broad specificity phosphatase PhoE